ncbi:FH2 domain-containing protein [Dirofilaria immitis]
MDKKFDDTLLLEEIQRCPGKYFTQYLYGTDTVGIIDLLNRLIQSKNGFELSIECLSCWQDLIGANYCLEPISSELQQIERAEIICLCLKFLNRLLKYSPNAIARIRIDHELKELNVSERVGEIRSLLSSGIFGEFDREISEQIEHWQLEHSQNSDTCIRGRSSSFTEAEDSNSFTEESEEEEEEYRMASVETVHSSPSWNNNSLDDPCYKDSTTLIELINLLKNKTDSVNVSNLKQLIEALLLKCNPNDAEMIMGVTMGTDKQKIEGEVKDKKDELIKASAVPGITLSTIVTSSSPAPPPPPPPPLPPSSETSNGPPPPPPLQLNVKGSRLLSKKKLDIPKALKPKAMPKAGSQMKQIQWTKIPIEKVIGDGMQKIHNVWMSSARLTENELHLNFDELESMFSCAATRTCTDTSNIKRRTTRKNAVITLLSHKRSFNVSIFLKQFKEGTFQIIENVRNGHGEFFGLERLNSLRAILPDNEEIEILQGFTGDKSQLGIAEQFFLNLLTVSDYRLILDCMILKEELNIAFETLLPHINTIINSCIEIKESKALPKIFCMLVQIGNFLNANATFGNAAGFKLNSLWRILDVKATQKSITLLHFIAMQDRECAEKLLDELLTVPVAARLSLESIRNDVRIISDKLSNMSIEVIKRNDIRFFENTSQHFMNSREHMENMQEQLEQMDQLIYYLAAYFCEDEKHFKIEECFKILSTFIFRLRDALSDNEKRTGRLKCLEKRANVENIMSNDSSKFNLLPKIDNSNRTLEEFLENDSHSDIRHSRSRPNITQANIMMKRSSDEREDRKIVHLAARNKLSDRILDEGDDDMSPIMKLRKQSRNKSDAYLIRNSQNLDEFLEVAEKVEKKVVKQHVEYNKETPHELIEMSPTFSTSTENASSTTPELERMSSNSTSQKAAPEQNASFIDDDKPILHPMDKVKQRVAVVKNAEIPLSKTIRGVRTLKSVQKTQTSTKDPRTSPYQIKLSTVSTSRKSTREQQPITLQSSAIFASANQKVGMLEQTCDDESKKSSVQSEKSFTTISTKEAVIKRRNGIVPTNKIEMTSSRTIKTTSSRKSYSGMSATSLSSVSAKNTTSVLMPKKSVGTAHSADTEIPCTSNSSAENSPQRACETNAFITSAAHEHNVDSQSFWESTYRSTCAKSTAALAKKTLHTHENTSHSITASNHDPSFSKLPSISRPKSAPQRISTITGATSSTRTTPSRISPSTLRRPVRGTTKSNPQTSTSTSSVTLNPNNRTMKRADSCSTASRPLLIKTGTVSRPRWK